MTGLACTQSLARYEARPAPWLLLREISEAVQRTPDRRKRWVVTTSPTRKIIAAEGSGIVGTELTVKLSKLKPLPATKPTVNVSPADR
jgi:hypothetical protein